MIGFVKCVFEKLFAVFNSERKINNMEHPDAGKNYPTPVRRSFSIVYDFSGISPVILLPQIAIV